MVNFENYLSMLNPQTRMEVGNFYGANMEITNSGYNPYASINPNAYNNVDRKEQPADQLYADLIRAQTQDYLTRFAPVEDYMAGQITATGTKALEGDLTRTRGAVLGADANIQAQQARSMSRMGLNYNQGSANNTGTVSALVGGLNDTRMRDADRRNAILSGNLGALSQKARGSVS